MAETKTGHLSENFAEKYGTKIEDLPFIKIRNDQIVFWSVKPTGDYDKDCKTGREYGSLALDHMAKADFAPLLTWCIMEMPRKENCSGIEVGFLEIFSEIAVSNFISTCIQFGKLSN